MKSWLQGDLIEVYPPHNEGKFAVAIRFIRTLSKNIYKYMNSVSKNAYICKSVDIVNKYKNTYHSKIKMKPIDVKLRKYFDFDEKIMKNILDLRLMTT